MNEIHYLPKQENTSFLSYFQGDFFSVLNWKIHISLSIYNLCIFLNYQASGIFTKLCLHFCMAAEYLSHIKLYRKNHKIGNIMILNKNGQKSACVKFFFLLVNVLIWLSLHVHYKEHPHFEKYSTLKSMSDCLCPTIPFNPQYLSVAAYKIHRGIMNYVSGKRSPATL